MEIVRLSDRKVVSITGLDAASLLQGLVTCDVDRVETSGIAYGALLTPQGKVLFDFILYKSPEGFLADLPFEAAEGFMKRMKLYKLRAKVDLLDRSDSVSVYQIFGDEKTGRPDPRHGKLGSRFVASMDDVQTLLDESSAFSVDKYHARRIALGIPEAPHDFAYGDVFPHDVALDSLGAVSFQKGCYVGQEVVSRMEHRGTARRRIVVVAAGADLAEQGVEISADDRSVGILGSRSGKNGIATVRLDRVRAAQTGNIEIRCGEVPVTLTLPDWATYSWPEPKQSPGEP